MQDQLTMFIDKMDEDIPYPSVCPRLNKHLLDVVDKKYGRCELDDGWILVEEENESFKWVAREPADCMKDLKELAINMKVQLDSRFASSFPKLNSMLHKCLDFGVLFTGLCGVRKDGTHPVNKGVYAALGATEFRKCVEFVSQLPHMCPREEHGILLRAFIDSVLVPEIYIDGRCSLRIFPTNSGGGGKARSSNETTRCYG